MENDFHILPSNSLGYGLSTNNMHIKGITLPICGMNNFVQTIYYKHTMHLNFFFFLIFIFYCRGDRSSPELER